MQTALYDQHLLNIVRLELPKDQPDFQDRYEAAAATYATWRGSGILVSDPAPALYPHLSTFSVEGSRHERHGVLVALRLEPLGTGVVRPHEHTLARPKEDRIQLLRACRANFSPIWVVCRGPLGAAFGGIWERASDREPDSYARDAGGVLHSLWVVDDVEAQRLLHDALVDEPVYIADGHHRYETALQYRDELQLSGALGQENQAARFVMAYLVDSTDPGFAVLPIHRLVRSVGGLEAARLRAVLGRWFELIDRGSSPRHLMAELAALDGSFGIWAPALGMRAIARWKASEKVPDEIAAGHSDAWRRLDVVALHALGVDQLWGEGTAALAGAGLLRYAYSLDEVEEAVTSGEADIAFLLQGTPIEQILALADAGERMPEKSTYFYPKPPTGMVVADLGGENPAPRTHL
jgi:uncharacterized protein (DUF1015 family)